MFQSGVQEVQVNPILRPRGHREVRVIPEAHQGVPEARKVMHREAQVPVDQVQADHRVEAAEEAAGAEGNEKNSN